jgi:hypothetical protein
VARSAPAARRKEREMRRGPIGRKKGRSGDAHRNGENGGGGGPNSGERRRSG